MLELPKRGSFVLLIIQEALELPKRGSFVLLIIHPEYARTP